MTDSKTPTYTVFVSSTYLDNAERRKVIEDAIIRANMVPVGMERFAADTLPPVEKCEQTARDSDLLVGIIARRYGWIPEGGEVSITELEFCAAEEAGRPMLVFVIDPTSAFVEADMDSGTDRWDKQKKLEIFKERFSTGRTAIPFRDEKLGLLVYQSLIEWKQKRQLGEVEVFKPDLETEIRRYLIKAESLHASLRVAGFSTKLRVPIDLAELYVPLRAVADLRSIGDARFADARDAEECLGTGRESVELSLPDAFRECERLGGEGGL